jgi:two-component system, NarL family, sensor histidine kinase DegS
MEIRALPDTSLGAMIAGNVSRPQSFRDWSLLFRARLHDRRFWFIQAMIVGVTLLYAICEATEPTSLTRLYFVPASLYIFPVLYASLNFGLEGALPTALWSTALATPSVVLSNRGMELVGESFAVASMLLLATLVAVRVDKEAVSRRVAEESERERHLSEMKYRYLFEAANEAILVVDDTGTVQEGNAAAAALTGRTISQLPSASLDDLLGTAAPRLTEGDSGHSREQPDFSIRRPNGDEIWLHPVLSVMPSVAPTRLTQILLRDVTEQHGLQRYAREIVRAQEGERQRIAQELHDVSVQSAILICRRLDAASEAAEQGNAQEVTDTIAEARHTAEMMADELRRFSRDLRPLILDDLGLVPALKRLLLELRERSRIDVRFDVGGTVRRLDSSVELALFRIGQEALRNVENHAHASRATMRITFGETDVRLTVNDNGAGFLVPRLSNLVSAGRLGLVGMQERARLVGGQCEVASNPGSGARVTADVPALERAGAGEAQPLTH